MPQVDDLLGLMQELTQWHWVPAPASTDLFYDLFSIGSVVTKGQIPGMPHHWFLQKKKKKIIFNITIIISNLINILITIFTIYIDIMILFPITIIIKIKLFFPNRQVQIGLALRLLICNCTTPIPKTNPIKGEISIWTKNLPFKTLSLSRPTPPHLQWSTWAWRVWRSPAACRSRSARSRRWSCTASTQRRWRWRTLSWSRCRSRGSSGHRQASLDLKGGGTRYGLYL